MSPICKFLILTLGLFNTLNAAAYGVFECKSAESGSQTIIHLLTRNASGEFLGSFINPSVNKNSLPMSCK